MALLVLEVGHRASKVSSAANLVMVVSVAKELEMFFPATLGLVLHLVRES